MKISVLSAFLFMFNGLFAQPPVYMGSGLELNQVKGSWYYTYYSPWCIANGVMPKPKGKGVKLLEISDDFTNQSRIIHENTTRDDILKLMVGPEGSTLKITVKKGGMKTFTLQRNMLRKEGGSYDFIMSTDQELAYIKKNFPYNYAAFARPENRDKDSFTDADDKCPDYYGSTALYGCPEDTDGDLLHDSIDRCRNQFGYAEDQGCPNHDLDGDNVPDDEDECMYKPGYLGGACPYEYESEEYNDEDEDGLPDEIDACPEKWGSQYTKGCPGNATTITEKANFQVDLCRYILEFFRNPEALTGKFLGNESEFQVYNLKKNLVGISADKQYTLKDPDGDNSLLFIFDQSLDFRAAMNYFSSMVSDFQQLDLETEDLTCEADYDEMMYEPDYPEEHFVLRIFPENDKDEDSESSYYFILRVQLFRYEEKSRLYNEMRLWVEPY